MANTKEVTLKDCIDKISQYLNADDKPQPRFVDFQNIEDMNTFKDEFESNLSNKIIDSSDYSEHDECLTTINLINISTDIKKNESQNLFIRYLTTNLKLLGKEEFKKRIKNFASNTYPTHVVFLCYQSRDYLRFDDPRLDSLVYEVNRDEEGNESKRSKIPSIIFIRPELDYVLNIYNDKIYDGVNKLAEAVEKNDGGIIYVKSHKKKGSYIDGDINIDYIENEYKMLCHKYNNAENLPEHYGNDENWKYALKVAQKYGSLTKAIKEKFGNENQFYKNLKFWDEYDDQKKWLCIIGLKIFGTGNNLYLEQVFDDLDNPSKQESVEDSDIINKFTKLIYTKIFDIEYNSKNFWNIYKERKELMKLIFRPDSPELYRFKSYLDEKEKYAIYYLTDTTKIEKNYLFECLNKYFRDDKYQNEIRSIVQHIYPDLYDYLQPYDFEEEILNDYFQNYKYQKITNCIYPKFKELVKSNAKKGYIYTLLSPRSRIAMKYVKDKAHESLLYFFDALGVEYLSYIQSCCKKRKLNVDIKVCSCELPSITKFNKDFIDYFDKNKVKEIKDLDKIKHGEVESFDYTKTKLPIHLISELEIIDNVIKNIESSIKSNNIERAYIISDHGSSRLAVISETEINSEMQEKGEHSGRCCKINEIDNPPTNATSQNGYWILKDYDRFKGGRKANVEVHGGASLEEVTVPIIELTMLSSLEDIVVEILTEQPIKVKPTNKDTEIHLKSNTIIKDLRITVSGVNLPQVECTVDIVSLNDKIYSIKIPDLAKTGKYNMTIYSGNNKIKDLMFDAKNIAEPKKKQMF